MKKKIIILGITLCVVIAVIAIAVTNKRAKNEKEQTKSSVTMNEFTNLVSDEDKEEVKKLMVDANLSNTDTFINWVSDFNQTMKEDVGLVSKWTPVSDQSYKVEEMAASWDTTHEEMGDSNGRLAAYLLMQNRITAKEHADYGNNLMMDMDQLEGESMYEVIKDDLYKFSAVFDEVDIKGIKTEEEFAKAYPNVWKERQVSFASDQVSLINVVTEDPYDQVANITHSGVLIKEDGYVLFIEKIAATEPYQVMRFASVEDLATYLTTERVFQADDQNFAPVVLENDTVVKVQ